MTGDSGVDDRTVTADGTGDGYGLVRASLVVLQSGEDSDQDGLSDEDEIALGTNPLEPDTDGDGWPDGVEVNFGGEPLNPQAIPQLSIVGAPAAVHVVRIASSEPGGLALNTTLAQPSQVDLVRPTTGELGNTPFNVVVASPPASIVRPVSGGTGGLGNTPLNVVVASPPASIVRPASGGTGGLALNTALAQPSRVELVRTTTGELGDTPFNAVVARPPASILRSVSDGTGGLALTTWFADNRLWEVGAASAGPGNCFSGTRCAGTVLDGNYEPNTDSRLISRALTLPNVVGPDKLELRFWAWFSYSTSDSGVVQVSVRDAGTGAFSAWQTVGTVYFGDSEDWIPGQAGLTTFAGKTVRIAFSHTAVDAAGVAGTDVSSGWYVDEVHFVVVQNPVPGNTPPSLDILSALTVQDGQSAVLGNQHLTLSDADGDVVSVELVGEPAHGVLRRDGVALAGGGTFTQADIDAGLMSYTHLGAEATSDGFTFFGFDPSGGTVGTRNAPIPFPIVIEIPNRAPEAFPGTLTTDEDTPFDGVLDTRDADGDTVTCALSSQASKGVIEIVDSSDCTYTYTPNPDVEGGDSFAFVASDGTKTSGAATVLATITPVNDAPVASDASFTTRRETPKSGRLEAEDVEGDNLVFALVDLPALGTVVLTDPATGDYRYTPNAGVEGADRFTFEVSDGALSSSVAAVDLTVAGAPNTAPVAEDGVFTTAEDTVLDDVLAAFDGEGDTLTFRVVTPPANGTVQVTNAATGAFRYTPDPDAHGDDGFSFEVNDGTVDSNIATMAVAVTPVNDAPTIGGVPDPTVTVGAFYRFTPNGADVEGDPIVYEAVNVPPWSVFDPGTGTLSGTAPIVSGVTQGVLISASDGQASSALPAFDLTVLGVAPVTTATPPGGVYGGAQQVALACQAAVGNTCDVFYVMNDPGALPQDFLAYTGPIDIATDATLRFYATATPSGESEVVRSEAYVIDTVAPGVAIVSPLDGDAATEFPQIAGTASDAGSGLFEVALQVTDGSRYLAEVGGVPVLTPVASWVAPAVDAGAGTWSYATPDVGWPGGTYSITARARDAAGNEAVDAVIIAYLDPAEQAFTTLSVEVSARSVLTDVPVDVFGALTRLPETGVSLAGRTIELTVTDTDGIEVVNASTETFDDAGSYRFEGVGGFAAEGLYSIDVVFADTALLAASGAQTSLLVGLTAGYAVIVQGRVASDEGLEAHNLTTNRIYAQLIARGFLDENILYFNFDPAQGGVDAVPTKAALEEAITQWARAKLNAAPAPLYVIGVDHGNVDTFFLDGAETVTPGELDGWLDTLEIYLTPKAHAQHRVVVLGACYAGSFIPVVSSPGRVVIASAAADEESYRGPLEFDVVRNEAIRSGEFFIDELFKALGAGRSLGASFARATAQTEVFTRRGDVIAGGVNQFFDDAVQHPLLDDNGDSVGSNVLDPDGDGAVADTLFLGTADAGGDFAESEAPVDARFVEVTPALHLGAGETTATLWGIADDDARVGAAWVEIRAPSKALRAEGGTIQLANELTKVLLSPDAFGERWEAVFDGFDESGTWEVFYFVRGATTDSLSPMRRSILYRDKPGNRAPEAFSLRAPADDAVLPSVLVLDWGDAVDPDGDAVRYRLRIATDASLINTVHAASDIATSSYALDGSAGLAARTPYYWSVEAVDGFGAVRTAGAVRRFVLDDSTGVPGLVEGVVHDAATFAGLAGAHVDDGAGAHFESNADGRFVLALPAGTATLTALRGGYAQATVDDVMITAGATTRLAIAMTPGQLFAHDVAHETPEDTVLAEQLDATVPAGTAVTYLIDALPARGDLVVDPDTGAFTYAPHANASGGDGFAFHVDDGAGTLSETATVSIGVLPVNDAPLLADPAGRVLPSLVESDTDNAGVPVAFVIGGLASDVDSGAVQGMAVTGLDDAAGEWQYSLDGGATWAAFGAVSSASATLLAADALARVRLVPAATGQSAITFRAWDQTSGANGEAGVDTSANGGASAFSTAAHPLALNVRDVNRPPQAAGATLATDEDTRRVAQLDASDADGDALTFTLVSPPGKGRVTLINAATGIYAYTPDADVHGLDSFSFKVSDGQVNSNVATLTVVITPTNDAPFANGAS
ncbi:MAG: tandem-95 repeat protein, partial [Candidatus Binatia bacterium]